MLTSAQIQLETFATNLPNLTEITHANDTRLFAVLQTGEIKIVQSNGSVNPTNFINLSSKITYGGERGLLGLAFHPNYVTNGYFFVYYNNTAGNIVVARYSVNPTNPDVADISTEKIILNIPKPFSNHNGGSIHFDNDGYLWVGTGDGGSGGDPNNNSQNTTSFLGKILRIDINTTATAYTTPSTNPFVGTTGLDEIWSYGLRNPWKFTFDRSTNTVYIADVGQGNFEEINKMPMTQGGLNYGWRCYEANATYNATGCPNINTLTFPVAFYSLAGAPCAITGGYVYRGSVFPDLVGKYFFADYCSDQIGIMETNSSFTWYTPNMGSSFTTFGVNSQNELFVGGRGNGGIIYRIKSSNLFTYENFKYNLKIYPNPAKDQITISGKQLQKHSIEIYTLEGRKIFEENLDHTTSTINTQSLPKGVYIINILNKGERKYSQKLMIE